MSLRAAFLFTFALVAVAVPAARVFAGSSYQVRWDVVAGGGQTFAAGGTYALGGTAAQAATGPSSGGSYGLAGGLWTQASNPNVDVAPAASELPLQFAVRLGGPNPFHSSTSIRFDLPQPSRVSILIFGIDGRLVRRVADEAFAAGRHAAYWDGRDGSGGPVAPGIYFARVEAGNSRATLRLARVR